jgi:hypothetical protein
VDEEAHTVVEGRQLSQALDEAFVTWLASQDAVALHRSLQGTYGILVRFTSLQDAVAFLRDGTNDDYQTKDALLRAFLEAYQAASGRHRPAQLLLGILQPGLSRLFHQHAGRWPGLEDAELWAQMMVSLLEVVCSYDLKRRPHRIAKNLLMDTLRRTLRWLHANHGRPRALPPHRATGDRTVEAAEAMPYVQVLVRDGIVSGEDAAILLATRIVGERLPVLARKRGRSYEALRKRRQRAQQAIRQHLRTTIHHIALRDGVDPGSVPLSEALEHVIRDVPYARDW